MLSHLQKENFTTSKTEAFIRPFLIEREEKRGIKYADRQKQKRQQSAENQRAEKRNKCAKERLAFRPNVLYVNAYT